MEYNINEGNNFVSQHGRYVAGNTNHVNVDNTHQQLSIFAQRKLNRLLKMGVDEQEAHILCVRSHKIIRRFTKQHKIKRKLLAKSLVAPMDNMTDNNRIAPMEPMEMASRDHNMNTDSRNFARKNHRYDDQIHGPRNDRMDIVHHARPSMNHKRTHPRDYSTSHRTDFVDNGSGSSRQNFVENPESFREYPNVQEDRDIKVKIVNRKGPMTDDQMKIVHRCLLSAIVKCEGSGARPKFKALIPSTGWINISCNDEQSLKWLQLSLSVMRPWPRSDLFVVSQNERFATAYFPKSETESIECALRLLKVQNKGLQTDLWRVLNFREDKEGIFMELSIDESSAETLYSLGGKVTLGFSSIHFNFIEK